MYADMRMSATRMQNGTAFYKRQSRNYVLFVVLNFYDDL